VTAATKKKKDLGSRLEQSVTRTLPFVVFPIPDEKHFISLPRFATDYLAKCTELTNELEDKLVCSGTASLGLRVGLPRTCILQLAADRQAGLLWESGAPWLVDAYERGNLKQTM
jgi:hypothetical protein